MKNKGAKISLESKENREPICGIFKIKQNTDDFFNEIIKLKRMSVIKNIGLSIGALGI